MQTHHLKSKWLRCLVGVFSILMLIFISSIEYPSPAFFFFLILTFFYPIPLALFGQWPPNDFSGVPLDVLSPFEKLQWAWREMTLPMLFLLAFLYFGRYLFG